MSESVSPPDGQLDQAIADDLAATIDALEEGDLVRVNHGSRIWTVVDVVDQDLPMATRRDSQRGVRLSNTPRESDPVVHALIVDRYPDRVEASLRVLESDRPGEVRPVEQVEHTDGKIPWVVVRRSSSLNTWHRPHPGAVMNGLAEPACRNYPTTDDYRFVERKVVKTHYEPCKDCFMTWTPVEIGPVTCPRCGSLLTRVLLDGRYPESISTLQVECPSTQCGFIGDVGTFS